MTVRTARHLGVIAVFAVPAAVLWWHVWSQHPASTLACTCGDAGQAVWFIAWPAHAIAHGLDPLVSTAVWSPSGANLLSNASFPVVGIVLAPLTWLAGPVVSTNVALTLAPALSAWGAWLACRRVVGRTAPAWVAGLLFGYSPFIVTNDASGHIGLALLVVPPLMVVVLYDLWTGARPATRQGILLGVLAAVQFLISAEVLAVLLLAGAVGAVTLALVAWHPIKQRWHELARAAAVAALVALVLADFPLWLALFGPRHITGAPWNGLAVEANRLSGLVDAGNTIARTPLLELGGYEGPSGPPSDFLGIVLLVLAVASAAVTWRRRATRVLTVVAVATAVLSLGVVLWTTGITRAHSIWLPWRLFATLPLVGSVGPQRFTAVTDLAVVLLVAAGLAWCEDRIRAVVEPLDAPTPTPTRARPLPVAIAAVAALGVAAFVPIWLTYHAPFTTERVTVPQWFTRDAPQLRPRSVVFVYPFPSSVSDEARPMVWQAVEGMSFDMVGGYLKVPDSAGTVLGSASLPKALDVLSGLTSITAGPFPAGTPAELRAVRASILSTGATTAVVVDKGATPGYAVELLDAAFGVAPRLTAGAWVFDLRAVPPASSWNATLGAVALGTCRSHVINPFSTPGAKWRDAAEILTCMAPT